jgi:signal-transduction protein with cAMP-binding, CBS, and nucleotidyltransferase domain
LAKAMAAKRTDVALLVQDESLAAIVTDHDITRKVIALGLDPEETVALTVGTISPQCVEASDSALDALTLMAEHKFRHAPVLDGGMIVGVLNIARCL